MEERENKIQEEKGRKMKISEAKNLTKEEFEKLDEAYGGFEKENTRNHPVREENESFMEFIKKGSDKIKSDPAVKKILGRED